MDLGFGRSSPRVRTEQSDQGPATQTETLTCTKWTGPLGLKQKRYEVNLQDT